MCLDFTGVNIGQGEFGINSSVNIHLFSNTPCTRQSQLRQNWDRVYQKCG